VAASTAKFFNREVLKMNRNPSVFHNDTVLTPNKLALVTDLTCGFNQKQAKQLGYDIVNFSVNIQYAGQEIAFLDGNDANDGFYARLADNKTTGAKTGSGIDDFLKIFKQRLSEDKCVVYLGISDSLSAGMRNAAITAKDMIHDECPELNADNILILPTHCVAGGLGLALRMLRSWLDSEPRTVEELQRRVEYLGDHVAHFFTLFSIRFVRL
jgi:fatty acid-binding protein DegV